MIPIRKFHRLPELHRSHLEIMTEDLLHQMNHPQALLFIHPAVDAIAASPGTNEHLVALEALVIEHLHLLDQILIRTNKGSRFIPRTKIHFSSLQTLLSHPLHPLSFRILKLLLALRHHQLHHLLPPLLRSFLFPLIPLFLLPPQLSHTN